MQSVVSTVYAKKAHTLWYQSVGYSRNNVLDFAIYTGATDDKKTTDLGQKVVLKLMEQYRGKGHCLFIDNFYTSPSLLLALLDQGTYCTGTVCTNRKGFPKQLPLIDMVEGSKGCLCAYYHAQ